jgi:hypothetical protein
MTLSQAEGVRASTAPVHDALAHREHRDQLHGRLLMHAGHSNHELQVWIGQPSLKLVGCGEAEWRKP